MSFARKVIIGAAVAGVLGLVGLLSIGGLTSTDASDDSAAGSPGADAASSDASVPGDGAGRSSLPPGRPVEAEEPVESVVDVEAAYRDNLALILASDVRNTNHDDSPFLDTPSADLVPTDHYGPRSDYLGDPGGNPEHSFPIDAGGQFRAGCEFSHFAYDDPLVFPNQPGASHLHMFFGNTHVNAFSSYETLLDSGGSSCNGQELNRSGYWAPAMFDGEGNVRVPERVVVYYKGEGRSNGESIPFAPETALIATENLNERNTDFGGANGKFSFVCSDQFSSTGDPLSNTIPDCDGNLMLDRYGVTDNPHVTLEMNVKFPQCWNGEDPADWINNYAVPRVGNWYGSDCEGEFDKNLPNIEYFVNYRVDVGESTGDWYLASDVDRETFTRSVAGGTSVHADWWGAWHAETNQMWIDNCVNFRADTRSGCGFGYLSDGGPDGQNPYDGPALRLRPQYTGPHKIPAATIFDQLCRPHTDRPFNNTEDAAWCVPAQ